VRTTCSWNVPTSGFALMEGSCKHLEFPGWCEGAKLRRCEHTKVIPKQRAPPRLLPPSMSQPPQPQTRAPWRRPQRVLAHIVSFSTHQGYTPASRALVSASQRELYEARLLLLNTLPRLQCALRNCGRPAAHVHYSSVEHGVGDQHSARKTANEEEDERSVRQSAASSITTRVVETQGNSLRAGSRRAKTYPIMPPRNGS
jgi:hypothetical protein